MLFVAVSVSDILLVIFPCKFQLQYNVKHIDFAFAILAAKIRCNQIKYRIVCGMCQES